MLRKRCRWGVLFVLGVVGFLPGRGSLLADDTGQDQYELRLKFKAGDSYTDAARIRITMKVSSDDPAMAAMGNVGGDFTIETDARTSVTSIGDGGTASLEYEIQKIKVSGSMMGQAIHYDSEKKSDDGDAVTRAMTQAWKDMVHKPFRAKVDAKGRISYENLPGGNQMFDMGGIQGMKVFLPKGKVKIGDTWSDEMDIPIPNVPNSKMKLKVSQKLEKIDIVNGKKCAVIGTDKIEMSLSGDTGEGEAPMGMKMDIHGDGNLKGYVSLEDGSFLKTTGKMDITMNMGMEDPDSGESHSFDMIMTMEMDQSRK